jgi:hypothetical protein
LGKNDGSPPRGCSYHERAAAMPLTRTPAKRSRADIIVSVLNITYGIGALDDANIFVDDRRDILTNLNTLGWARREFGAVLVLANRVRLRMIVLRCDAQCRVWEFASCVRT